LLTRRRFLAIGLAGAAVLAATRLLERPAGAPSSAYRVLDRESAALIGALVPVVLAGALPAQGAAQDAAIREVVAGFDRAVSGLAPAVREEIDELLGVLRFGPTRYLLTGIAASLEAASAEQISAFLSRWRTSRFDLLRAGYQALTQLIQASWYGNSASWPTIGYPGPPDLNVPMSSSPAL
jgi:hypothetical protein